MAVTEPLDDQLGQAASALSIAPESMDETTDGLRRWFRAVCHAVEPAADKRLAVVAEACLAPFARGRAAALAARWHSALTRVESPQGLPSLFFLRDTEPRHSEVRAALASQLAEELGHQLPAENRYEALDREIDRAFFPLPADAGGWDLIRGGPGLPHASVVVMLWREGLPGEPAPDVVKQALQGLLTALGRSSKGWFDPPQQSRRGESTPNGLHPIDALLSQQRPSAARRRRDELVFTFPSKQAREQALAALKASGRRRWNGGKPSASGSGELSVRVQFCSAQATPAVKLAISVAYGHQHITYSAGSKLRLVSANDGIVGFNYVKVTYFGTPPGPAGTTATMPLRAIARGVVSRATEAHAPHLFADPATKELGTVRLGLPSSTVSRRLHLPFPALREHLYRSRGGSPMTPDEAVVMATPVPALKEATVLDEVPTDSAVPANKELFLEFLLAIPKPLTSGATVVMDNSNLHWKGQEQERKLRQLIAPMNTMYTPKYTPQLNPIERLFGFVKPLVRRDVVRGGVLDSFSVSATAQDAVYQYLTDQGVKGFIDRSMYRHDSTGDGERDKYMKDVLALLQPGSTILLAMREKLRALLG